jgi:hypothetical protein
MEGDHGASTDTISHSSSHTYYLQSNQSEFPRCCTCVEGRVAVFSILARTANFGAVQFPLQSICIPSSIEIVSDHCFHNCTLSCLAFESGSRISRLGRFAFDRSSLLSLYIPSSVETISDSCFDSCQRLGSLIFDRGSDSRRGNRVEMCVAELDSYSGINKDN